MSEHSEEESFLHRRGPMLGGIGVLLVFALAGYFAVRSLKGTVPPVPPKIQEISLVQPPPPPPPPPKLEEPPPPEQVIEEPKPEPEPQAETPPDEAPAGNDLGLDAEGVAGADGFGLRAKKGGRGLIGGGDRNRWYAGLIQRDLQSQLADNDAARGSKYAVVVKLWISADGRIERFELMDSTGDAKSEAALRKTLSGLRLNEAPPTDMPQPVKLRVVSR